MGTGCYDYLQVNAPSGRSAISTWVVLMYHARHTNQPIKQMPHLPRAIWQNK